MITILLYFLNVFILIKLFSIRCRIKLLLFKLSTVFSYFPVITITFDEESLTTQVTVYFIANVSICTGFFFFFATGSHVFSD